MPVHFGWLLTLGVSVGTMLYMVYTAHRLRQNQLQYTTYPRNESSEPRTSEPSLSISGPNNSCCICYETMEMTSIERHPKTLSCRHAFHANCIYKWLQESRSCPVCRKSL